MTRVSTALALIALAVGSVAAAQTTPSTTQSTTSPTQSTSPQDKTDTKGESATMKDCIARHRASDPRMSEQDAKKACKDESTTPQR